MQRNALMLSVFAVTMALVAGSVVAADVGTDARTDAKVQHDGVEIVDEDGKLTPDERETVRTLVSNDGEAIDELRSRFGDADELALEVHGVTPDGRVHLDASAPGENPDTAAVVDLYDETVEIESVVLVEATNTDTVGDEWNVTEVDDGE
ncbi:hypothetical protein [Halorussus pelagicus]|uniref:hypothetical protein n=1 Tax=Halorussus pelagicus TaxID=2505977 RepID=UPI000FFC9FA3|nr:hypothetical protein [Halorussus pelagicus]